MSITPKQAWDEISTMLTRITDNRTAEAYLLFHSDMEDEAVSMPASVRHHHCWPGGYAIHIWEVMSNARSLVRNFMLPEKITFSRDDLITAAYVHDLDKLTCRYELDNDPPTQPQLKLARDKGATIEPGDSKAIVSMKIDAALNGAPLPDLSRLPRHTYKRDALDFEDGAIVASLCAEYGLPLSRMALHAVCVHHGGYSPMARTKSHLKVEQLGTILHVADLMSSQVQNGQVTPQKETE